MKESNAKQTKKIDMLNGTLFDKIILFAIPIAISSILQQLFNSADSAVIGKFVGAHALAAVGVNGPLVSLFVNLGRKFCRCQCSSCCISWFKAI